MTPAFDLLLGGVRSGSSSPAAGPTALVVDRAIGCIDAARVHLADGSGVHLGDPCRLDLGLDGAPVRVFTGAVAELRAGVRGVTVVAVGLLQSLADLHVAAAYADSTVGAVARDLAGRAGLQVADVDDGPLLHRLAVDARRSALTQLREVSRRFGLDVRGDRSGALVLRGVAAAAGPPALPSRTSLRSGAEVLDLRASSRSPSWQAVRVGGQSPSSTRGSSASAWLTADEADVQADAGRGQRRLLVVEPLARTTDLARDAAEGRLAAAADTAQQVAVRALGSPGLELGDAVAADGLPAGRTGRVSRLRHRLDPAGGFTTDVVLHLPAGVGGVL